MPEKPPRHRAPPDPADHHHLSSSASSSPPHLAAGAGSSVDRVLFKNLVEMVPLVESLMDRRASSSYNRRVSLLYTPTPSQLRKGAEIRGRKNGQSASARKRRDQADMLDDDLDGSSISSSRDVQKDRDELVRLLQEVNDLQKRLLEKEEALKSTEELLSQLTTACASLEDLRCQVAEKDSLLKSANMELYNTKITLADKQAALEKVAWETKMSNRKLEELEGNLVSKDFEVNALMQMFEELCKNDSATYPDYNITYYDSDDQYLLTDNDEEIDAVKMEEARTAYIEAVAVARMNPSEESLAAAAEARLRLQAFVL